MLTINTLNIIITFWHCFINGREDIMMKYTKILLTVASLLQLGLYSCRKQEIVNAEKSTSPTAASFAEIKSPQNFKWASNNLINLQIQPNSNDTRKSVLKVVDADGHVYLKKLHCANERFSTAIEVPAHIKALKVVYSGFQKEFGTGTSKVFINLK